MIQSIVSPQGKYLWWELFKPLPNIHFFLTHPFKMWNWELLPQYKERGLVLWKLSTSPSYDYIIIWFPSQLHNFDLLPIIFWDSFTCSTIPTLFYSRPVSINWASLPTKKIANNFFQIYVSQYSRAILTLFYPRPEVINWDSSPKKIVNNFFSKYVLHYSRTETINFSIFL